jgi:Tfp pilus assembly protein PilO
MAIDKETKEVDTLESLRIKNKKLKKKLKSLDLRVSELENIIKQKFETPQEYKPLKIAKRIPVSVRNKTKRDEELEKARRESTSR